MHDALLPTLLGVIRMDGHISRRTLIKRAGAGAALVWTAPAIVTSLGGQAYAASPTFACVECGTGPNNCCPGFGAGNIGTCNPANDLCAGGFCGCTVTHEGNCVCLDWSNFTAGCDTNADCAAGYHCITDCPGNTFCVAECGGNTGSTGGTGGLRPMAHL